jgi:hypothetical protein
MSVVHISSEQQGNNLFFSQQSTPHFFFVLNIILYSEPVQNRPLQQEVQRERENCDTEMVKTSKLFKYHAP